MKKNPTPLPVDDRIPELLRKLESNGVVVVSAPPGTGKSTRIPWACAQRFGATLTLEPRRAAARLLAHRVAHEQERAIGDEIGYRVRFENKAGPKTKLVYITEALLLKVLLGNPKLSGVNCVVIDEFHERSLPVDTSLAALKKLRGTRPDLKVVVMSATLNVGRLMEYLKGAASIEITSVQHPVSTHHASPRVHPTKNNAATLWAKSILDICHAAPKKNGVVFLPGRREISLLLGQLQGKTPHEVLPLHGGLSLSQQSDALSPRDQTPRLILSTNIAETSVTIPGLGFVIDSGWERQSRFDASLFIERLETVRISKSSQIQRSGRAGRLGPGTYHPLWLNSEEAGAPLEAEPDIARSNLEETFLLSQQLGLSLKDFFEEPPRAEWTRSLAAVNALNIPMEALSIPLPLRFACAFLHESRLLVRSAIAWMSLVFESPMAKGDLEILSSDRNFLRSDFVALCQQLQIPDAPPQAADLQAATACLLPWIKERVAIKRIDRQNIFILGSGRAAQLPQGPSSNKIESLLALGLTDPSNKSDGVIQAYSSLDLEQLKRTFRDEVRSSTRLELGSDGQLVAIEERMFLGSTLGPALRRKASQTEILGWIQKQKNRTRLILHANPEACQVMERIRFAEAMGAKDWAGALDDESLTIVFESYLQSGGRLEPLDVSAVFLDLLGFDGFERLKREFPKSVRIASGKDHKLNYDADHKKVVLSVRLQELLGQRDALVVGGKLNIPITLELLSPGYKPVQTTQDLSGFWVRSYPEIRGELMRRYPKHKWPIDPV